MSSTPICGIYAIRHKATGTCYVGQSIDIEGRWIDHRVMLRGNKHHSRYLQHAWTFYGEDAFEWVVLERIEEADRLTPREQHYLDTLPCRYNVCPAAESKLGFRHSAESLVKMSESAKRRGMSPAMLAYYERNRGAKKGPNPERNRKIGLSNKGRHKGEPWSPELRLAQERARHERVERLEAEGKLSMERKYVAGRARSRTKRLARITVLEAQLGIAPSEPVQLPLFNDANSERSA